MWAGLLGVDVREEADAGAVDGTPRYQFRL